MMHTESKDETVSSNSRIRRFARRNYEIYKEHFKSRNLKPVMTLDEFMENYASAE